MKLLARLGLETRPQRAWALYDVANSAWMTTIMTAVFPPFFIAIAKSAGLTEAAAGSRFAFATAISVILVGLARPAAGRDRRPARQQEALSSPAFVALGVASSRGPLLLRAPSAGRWLSAIYVDR